MIKKAIIIPARYGSTRLPAKALKMIGQKTLLRHVWDRCMEADMAEVFVATDHDQIVQEAASWGGRVIKTSPDCMTGSDRVAQAMTMLPMDVDVVINVQGDLPFVSAKDLHKVCVPLGNTVSVSTLVAPMPMNKQADPHTVKAIVSPNQHTDSLGCSTYRCHWFCRAALPYGMFHLGVYAYQKDALLHFSNAPQSLAERLESLEQLRFVELGYEIGACSIEKTPMEVNTQADYEAVCATL